MTISSLNKLKVLHVMDCFLRRTEVFIYNYLIAMNKTEAIVLAKSLQNKDEFSFLNLKIIPSPADEKSLLWIKTKSYEFFTGKSLRQYRIEKFVAKVKPAIIHAHFGPNGYEMLTIKRKFNIPLVTTFYGVDMSMLPRESVWQTKYAELFAEGDLFLVEGPYMRQKLIEIGAPEKKIKIQRIAIHLDKYPPWKPAYEIPTILFVGRFIEKKGLIYALQAINELRKEICNLQFRIIGDGPCRDKIFRFVEENKMKEFVTFLGMTPHNTVIHELSKANVFIHPSVTAENGDSEGGAPTIILEAQAVGIPIVSTYHADIPNVVQEGKGVFLCKERDIDGLIEGLKQALKIDTRIDNSFVKLYHDIKKEVVSLEKKYLELYR